MTTRPLTDATYAYVQGLQPGTRFTLGPAPQVYTVVEVNRAAVIATRDDIDTTVQIGQRRWPSIRATTQETP
jgi:hypothetical protein